MSKLERQLREDRLLRDAAQTLFKADIDRVKADLEDKSLGKRAVGRAKDGAAEMLDKAQDNPGRNFGVLALVGGALALWLARDPILGLLSAEEETIPPDEPPYGDDA